MEVEVLMRPLLLLAHLVCLLVAAVGMAFCDYALLVKRRIDMQLLEIASGLVAWALLALWVSGAAVVWLDTAFDLQVVMGQPKLLAKLTVVSLLTINGVLLHFWAFPALTAAIRRRRLRSVVPLVLGSVSAASWLYAMFLGLAKPFSAALGYGGFMALYAAAVCLAVAVSLTLVHPRLDQRLRGMRQPWPAAGRSGGPGSRAPAVKTAGRGSGLATSDARTA